MCLRAYISWLIQDGIYKWVVASGQTMRSPSHARRRETNTPRLALIVDSRTRDLRGGCGGGVGQFTMMRKQDERKQQFKKGMDQEESRRRREATSVQIRKEKKEDSLQKRRAPSRDTGSSSGPRSDVGTLPDMSLKAKLENLPEDVALLQSADPQLQLDATTRFRKLLSIERNPPIAEVIAAGVVPRLVQFLQSYDNTTLVFEAAWALTNVSSGTSEHTRVVIDNGAIPIFVHLLRLTNMDVHELQEQAIWALGNIAGDSPRCRDLVLSYGRAAAHAPLGLTHPAHAPNLGLTHPAHAPNSPGPRALGLTHPAHAPNSPGPRAQPWPHPPGPRAQLTRPTRLTLASPTHPGPCP